MSIASIGQAGTGKERDAAPGWFRLATGAVFALALAVAGALSLAKVPWDKARLHLEARAWPSAQATILSLSLADGSHVGSKGVEADVVLDVVYTFEVDGQRYTGHRGGLSDRAAPPDRELATLYFRLNFARLMGRTVPAFYDPQDPSRSYLDTDFAWKSAMLYAGAGVGAIAWGAIVMGARIRASRRPSLQ